MQENLTFKNVMDTSVARTKQWQSEGLDGWSALEWAGAMTGEVGETAEAVLCYFAAMCHHAGEAANAAKKKKRVEQELLNINYVGRSLTTAEAAQKAIAKEVCDTILYGLLLLAKVGITDIDSELRYVFNTKSEEYGFPERI